MDLQLSGKSAFVAASSKGLGRAIAERLLVEGANVTISSRDLENVETARDEILAKTDACADRLHGVECDVTDPEAIERAINKVTNVFGDLDILVSNHGGPPSITFEEADEDRWDSAYELVVKSNIRLADAALPYLEESDDGNIVTVTSASAQEPAENHALSNVFRLALYGLSKTLAVEYAPHIRANVVAPRFVMTDRVEYRTGRRAEHEDISFDEALEARTDEVLRDRPGSPEEFADAVAFVTSPRASYVTGDVVRVDGGWKRGVL